MVERTYPSMAGDSSALLPCPFCANTNVQLWSGFGTQAEVECSECCCGRYVQVADLREDGEPYFEFDEKTCRYPDFVIERANRYLTTEWNTRSPQAPAPAPSVEQIANIVSDYYDEDPAGRWLKCAQHIAAELRSNAGAQKPCACGQMVPMAEYERVIMEELAPARAALDLAYRELKEHDADYHHRTSIEINNKIVDALALAPSPSTASNGDTQSVPDALAKRAAEFIRTIDPFGDRFSARDLQVLAGETAPISSEPVCERCMGSGYSNHPDSGEVCGACGGQGVAVFATDRVRP